jgi:hypothetical protein
MAAIDALSARAKLAVLEALIRGAEGSPHVTWSASARATIDLLRGEMPQDAGGAADAHWDALPEEQRAEICRKLDSLEQQLKIQTAPKGWSGPRPMMSPDPTPSWIVMLLLILAVFGTAGVLLTIVQRWDRATQGDGSSSQAQSAFALAKSLAEEASKEFEKQRAAQDKAVAELEARKGDPADEVAKLTQTVEAARRDTLAADALAGRRWVDYCRGPARPAGPACTDHGHPAGRARRLHPSRQLTHDVRGQSRPQAELDRLLPPDPHPGRCDRAADLSTAKVSCTVTPAPGERHQQP